MQKKYNLVYFGSPDFSASILSNLLTVKDVRVVGVVTQPDSPKGRKQIMSPSSVAQVAQQADLPVFKPEKLDDANLAHLKILKPDLFLVVAYGKIIPDTWLVTPSIKTLNIHFSLLPKYRGALCVSEAIKNGDQQTGVTLMEMTSKLDQGPVIAAITLPIEPQDNVATLTEKLIAPANQLLKYELPLYLDGAVKASAQDEAFATLTPSYKSRNRTTAFIPFNTLEQAMLGKNSSSIHNLIRSLNPDPGAWTTLNGKDLKIISTQVVDNKLQLLSVQYPGKNIIPWSSLDSNH